MIRQVFTLREVILLITVLLQSFSTCVAQVVVHRVVCGFGHSFISRMGRHVRRDMGNITVHFVGVGGLTYPKFWKKDQTWMLAQVKKLQPDQLFLDMGSNDLCRVDATRKAGDLKDYVPEKVIRETEKLLARLLAILPNLQIALVPVLYKTKAAASSQRRFGSVSVETFKRRCKHYNELLQGLSFKYDNVYFVDEIRPDLHRHICRDGTHLEWAHEVGHFLPVKRVLDRLAF